MYESKYQNANLRYKEIAFLIAFDGNKYILHKYMMISMSFWRKERIFKTFW